MKLRTSGTADLRRGGTFTATLRLETFLGATGLTDFKTGFGFCVGFGLGFGCGFDLLKGFWAMCPDLLRLLLALLASTRLFFDLLFESLTLGDARAATRRLFGTPIFLAPILLFLNCWLQAPDRDEFQSAVTSIELFRL
jgi:hypothetical protein